MNSKAVELKIIYSDGKSLSGKITSGILNDSSEVIAFPEGDDLLGILIPCFARLKKNYTRFLSQWTYVFSRLGAAKTISKNMNHNTQSLILLNGKDVSNFKQLYNFLNSHSIRHYDPYFLKQFLLILRQFLYHNLSVEYQAYSLNMFTCFLHNGIIYCQNSILLNRVDQINVSSEYGSLVKLRGKKSVYLQLIHMI